MMPNTATTIKTALLHTATKFRTIKPSPTSTATRSRMTIRTTSKTNTKRRTMLVSFTAIIRLIFPTVAFRRFRTQWTTTPVTFQSSSTWVKSSTLPPPTTKNTMEPTRVATRVAPWMTTRAATRATTMATNLAKTMDTNQLNKLTRNPTINIGCKSHVWSHFVLHLV